MLERSLARDDVQRELLIKLLLLGWLDGEVHKVLVPRFATQCLESCCLEGPAESPASSDM